MSNRLRTFNVNTTMEEIRPGRWFQDGGGRRMFKIKNTSASGYPLALLGVDAKTGKFTSDLVVNAIDDQGITCCCPYNMDIFYVESEDDLVPEDCLYRDHATRHIKIKLNEDVSRNTGAVEVP